MLRCEYNNDGSQEDLRLRHFQCVDNTALDGRLIYKL
jgi:hypothetical protein